MQHKARLDRPALGIGSIITIAGSRLTVGDTVDLDPEGSGKVIAFGLGRLVLDFGGVVIELRPWHRGDGPAPEPRFEGPGSTWTVSTMENHSRSCG